MGDRTASAAASLTPTTSTVDERPEPYPPSVIDRVLAWVERLPGTPYSFYLLVLVASGALVNVVTWAGGTSEPGSIDAYRTSLPFYSVFILALMHHLNAVALRALATFRPALGASDERYAELRYELTTLPARETWLAIGASIPFTIVFSAYTPSLLDAFRVAPLVAAVELALYVASFALIAVFVYHTFRQLRTVSRIHASATNVNLFQSAPLYAFSWLTARTGTGLLVLNAYSILTDPATFVNPALFGLVVFAWLAAVASFVLPLRGMHDRIAEEKRRLLADVNERLDDAVQRLYADTDTSASDALDRRLTSLVTTRGLIATMPTWPWESGTLTRFLSAAVLPLAAAAITAWG